MWCPPQPIFKQLLRIQTAAALQDQAWPVSNEPECSGARKQREGKEEEVIERDRGGAGDLRLGLGEPRLAVSGVLVFV